ncbi:MAG: ATP-binding protein, partial [Fidelibacterota bacterium]
AESVKMILSGSSAAQIQLQFKDSLAGRKFVFYLHPLSFREFLLFKGKNTFAEKLKIPFYIHMKDDLKYFRNELLPLLEEFIIFGGYPEVVKTVNYQHKKRLLTELIDAYVIKDIRWLFNIRDINQFNHLIKYLAVSNGTLISMQNISNEVGISRQTVNSYLKILEDTFICRQLCPYFSNKLKEFRKMPKLYFLDTGLRNTLLESFVPLSSRTDAGMLFENYVFTQLVKKKKLFESLFFWRTQQKQEVDFIIKKEDNLFPLETKMRAGKLSHLKKFKRDYNCDQGFVVSLKNEFEKHDNITILPGYLI